MFGEGSISFLNARFKSLSLASCHLDYYLDLRLAYCGHMDLSDTVARDIIDLKPFDFNLDIGTINFSGMRLIGRNIPHTERKFQGNRPIQRRR